MKFLMRLISQLNCFFVPMWLNIFLGITVVLFIPYATLLLLYKKWFSQLKVFTIPSGDQPRIRFSVIIPARNEEENIGPCLQSVLSQTYPSQLFEIIVIDDFSTDNTASVVAGFQQLHTNLLLIDLEKETQGKRINSYKKKAIETAISRASGEWIITTDADCLVKKNWITSFAAIIQQQDPIFIAAPVSFINNGTVLSTFQYLDFATMQGITAASVSTGFHSMCNGANLAYRKDVFHKVNGFKGIDAIASGDDMLLMNKIKQQYPSQIAFLFSEEAIVRTHPMADWKSFLNEDKNISAVLILVYLYNLFLFLMPFLIFFNIKIIFYWLLFLVAKTIIELLFITPVIRFFGSSSCLWQFPFLQPLHITYMVTAGWLGKFGKYQWKGREVK
jgi:cellulose synthase/poly-beta-1,6-N-acetylglucosamine synthase-like glycosyltransferase